MKLNIITPVMRFENIEKIAETILPEVNWICVFDCTLKDIPFSIPKNCREVIVSTKLQNTTWGVAKVNEALKGIKEGYVYILDDDTILHQDFHILLDLNETYDFIHFNQEYKNGVKRTGGFVKRNFIDIGNFIASRELIGDTFLKEGTITPDGIWAEELYAKAKNPLYINKTFSIYNYLR